MANQSGPRGFHHVAVRVKDFDKSVGFYTQAIGLVQRYAWGEGDKRAAMLDTGDGSCLEVFAGGGEIKPEGSILHFALRTDDVDGALARAKAAGAEVTMEPKDLDIPSTPAPLLVRIAFCKGFDGELIEFFHERKA